MAGEMVDVWLEMWPQVWLPLSEDEDAPEDLFCLIYDALDPALRPPSTRDDVIVLLQGDIIIARDLYGDALTSLSVEASPGECLRVFDSLLFSDSGADALRLDLLEAAVATFSGGLDRAQVAVSAAIDKFLKNDRAVKAALQRRISDIVNDEERSRITFSEVKGQDLIGEAAAIGFFERVYSVLLEAAGERFAGRYSLSLRSFCKRYARRYDVRPPCFFSLHLPGVFAALLARVEGVADLEPHIAGLLADFEEALADLRHGLSETRLKSCISKQFVLLESLAILDPRIKSDTLGSICNELKSFPHSALREALKKIYGFASDYPGIRHAGTPKSALRPIEVRDMVALTVVLAGFFPYLTEEVSLKDIFKEVPLP
ncbi:MAG: hypothetical protein SF066_17705 [Thermoanaerobaculia bacterium]|nr:hypothetical protein [Thermoanaerobaculia bacterium]